MNKLRMLLGFLYIAILVVIPYYYSVASIAAALVVWFACFETKHYYPIQENEHTPLLVNISWWVVILTAVGYWLVWSLQTCMGINIFESATWPDGSIEIVLLGLFIFLLEGTPVAISVFAYNALLSLIKAKGIYCRDVNQDVEAALLAIATMFIKRHIFM